ncbi:hypothetical protein [Herbaspirillum sp. NPDC101397]|uniref:hypothetical protein n=1 Tax=Herbaspirillum sp. NPDC101397 TaxID=3364006 RepID=UPI00383ADFD0
MGDFTKGLLNRTRILGTKKIGYCVICGAYGNLSADHVPPKGCVVITDSVLRELTPPADPNAKVPGIPIQGGVKFRTICAGCNNGLLGAQYDPELKLFVDQIRQAIHDAAQHVYLPRIVSATIKPHGVAKSIVGHMLAAHSVAETAKRMDKLGANDSLREYFLGTEAAWPQEWKLYCWPYLLRSQVIIRHFAIMDTSLHDCGNKATYGHTIKFLPLGFWLVYQQHPEVKFDLLDISPSNVAIDETSVVTFDLRQAPHPGFPEHVTGNNVAMFSNEQASRVSPVMPRK